MEFLGKSDPSASAPSSSSASLNNKLSSTSEQPTTTSNTSSTTTTENSTQNTKISGSEAFTSFIDGSATAGAGSPMKNKKIKSTLPGDDSDVVNKTEAALDSLTVNPTTGSPKSSSEESNPLTENKEGKTGFRLKSLRDEHEALMSREPEEIGSTALMLGGYRGHLPVVECLLKAGAKIDATNGLGSTVLHLAVMAGHTEIVAYLLEYMNPPRKDPRFSKELKTLKSRMLNMRKSDTNATPLAIAIKKNHKEIADLLRKAGANS